MHNIWNNTIDSLPPDETPVLIVYQGEVRIGELRWEHPTFEETFKSFRFWDDPYNDGKCWEWNAVDLWTHLPEVPEWVLLAYD